METFAGWLLLFVVIVCLARLTARRLLRRNRLDDIIGWQAIQAVVAAGIFIALVADDYGPIGYAVLGLVAVALVPAWIMSARCHLSA